MLRKKLKTYSDNTTIFVNTKGHFYKVAEINLAMLFISTSGILGRYIDLPPQLTIFWRALLAAILIFLYCKYKKYSFRIGNKTDLLKIGISALLFGLHWITYFYALRLSNVAIGMISIFTYPVLTSFLEPLLLKTKLKISHVLLAILVLAGIYFLVPDFSFKNTYTKAIGFGVFSAFCYALRNIMLKPQVSKYNGSVLMFYQLVVITILLLPMPFIYESTNLISLHIGLPILALSLFTTAIGHTMFLGSFKHFSITTASIMSSVQPVFGIILGMLFLQEYPKYTTLIGGALILVSVVVESLNSRKK